MNQKSALPTVGADPELFVMLGDKYISAHNLFPGTKKEPHKVTEFGAVQVDGVAAEYNIIPARDAISFAKKNIQAVQWLKEFLHKQNKDYRLVAHPVATFDPKYFNEDIPFEAKILGCDPDLDAYSQTVNPPPETTEPFRTGAGHIHVGWYDFRTLLSNPHEPAHLADCFRIVKLLDASLFVMSRLWDDDERRRKLYGRRGSFRPKPYGLEYRVLSNAWVDDPVLAGWIFSAVQHALVLDDQDETEINDKEIVEAINSPEPSKELLNDCYQILTYGYNFPKMPEVYLT